MKLIVGLGNPGREYEKTRHNTGFIILEELRKLWDFPDFKFEKKFNSEISVNLLLPAGEGARRADEGQKIILAKPQTFMNNSGQSVKKILDFYNLSTEDIVVIQDDLDIEKGKFKIATDSTSAGHHGIDSLIEQLGTQKFRRIRVGISKTAVDNPACRLGAHNYVLENFSDEDLLKIKSLAAEIANII
jgi:PTH1 family peptidyl-tRNA hydrolase